MILIELNKKQYAIATEWNELSQQQLLQVITILFIKKYQPEQILVKLLQVLLQLNNYHFWRLPADEVAEYLYRVGFLVNDITLTKNLLPSYRFNDHTYYGPSDAIGNMVMQEFVFSESYFITWFENKEDLAALDNLVAVLYRPAKVKYDHDRNPDGDSRQPFNENICNWTARHIIKEWPLDVKLAIAYWYDGCRQHLKAMNPDVFEGGSGEEAKHGLISVMIGIAETAIHGDFEKVEKQHVNLMMITLSETIDKAKKMAKNTPL